MKQTITIPRLTEVTPVAELFETREAGEPLAQVLGSLATTETGKPTALAPMLRSALAAPDRRQPSSAPLAQLPKPQALTLEAVKGTLTNFGKSLKVRRVGAVTFELPFGMEHYLVNAATFKALAGRAEDTLLRRVGRRWKIVEDDEQIDLGDRTQIFRLGEVQIYS